MSKHREEAPDGLLLERKFAHVSVRLSFRYNAYGLTLDEFKDMNRQFISGRAQDIRVDERDMLEGWVKLRDIWVAAKFDPKTRLIQTVLPTKPPPSGKIPAPEKSAQPKRILPEAQVKNHARIRELEDENTMLKYSLDIAKRDLLEYKTKYENLTELRKENANENLSGRSA